MSDQGDGPPHAGGRRLRIAWCGESGSAGAGGVKGIAYLLLRGLAEEGHDVEVFCAEDSRELLAGLPATTSLRTRPTGWDWNRWYAKGQLRLFIASSLMRIRLQRRLASDVMSRQAERPFDVIFQMSHLESFFRGRRAMSPPLVVHPCTIARLEWEWHRAERDLSRGAERRALHAFVSVMLRSRAAIQHRHARLPDLLVGPSPIFRSDLQRVFGVSASRVAVLRHPVEVPAAIDREPDAGRALLLFVSRMSSRKGVELVIELSRRLSDLAAEVEIQLVGGASLWSDYTPLMRGLDPAVATYRGEVPHAEVEDLMRHATAVLIPSRFEPGSIVAGEALARGVPIIASSAVGPSDLLAGSAGRVFGDGDIDALERVTRDLLCEVKDDRLRVASAARAVAEHHLEVSTVVRELEGILRSVSS